MDFAKILAAEFVILGFVVLMHGFYSCNQSEEYGIAGLDVKCYFNYGLLSSAVMFGGIAISSVVIRAIEKNSKKKKPKRETRLPWPAKFKENP